MSFTDAQKLLICAHSLAANAENAAGIVEALNGHWNTPAASANVAEIIEALNGHWSDVAVALKKADKCLAKPDKPLDALTTMRHLATAGRALKKAELAAEMVAELAAELADEEAPKEAAKLAANLARVLAPAKKV
jgi:hypothetical protein